MKSPFTIATAAILAFTPVLVVAQLFETSTHTYYISVSNVSLLQRVFGISTSPEVLMFMAILSLMAFIGFTYIAFGVIVFYLFRD
ncbi:MAG: hypothetical protein ACPGO5_00700 [Patescibacteria group bacterium]